MMKRAVFVLVSCAVCLGSVSNGQSLTNPGFESFLTGWVNDPATPPNFGVDGSVPNPGGAHSGAHYASFSHTGTTTQSLYQQVSVTAGATYQVSAWFNLGGFVGSTVTASLGWVDGGTYHINDVLVVESKTSVDGAWAGDTWQQVSGTIVPSGSTIAIAIKVRVTGSAGANIDDVAITQTAPPGLIPGVNPVASETFDAGLPAFDDASDGDWGSAAIFSWDGSGAMAVQRTSQGSSVRVVWYTVPPNSNVTVSVDMAVPDLSLAGTYWLETLARAGQHTGLNADDNATNVNWTMIKKFDDGSLPANTGGAFVTFSDTIAVGDQRAISVAFKAGGLGTYSGPKWDNLILTSDAASAEPEAGVSEFWEMYE